MKYLALLMLLPSVALAQAPYVTGGIGSEEREAIQAQASNYNLQVKAAFTTGHYIADVLVQIKDAKGEMALEAVTEGPFFYAKLEPGTYTITASFEGSSQSQKISIDANTKQRQTIFRFKPVGNPEL